MARPWVPFSKVCMSIASGTWSAGESVFQRCRLSCGKTSHNTGEFLQKKCRHDVGQLWIKYEVRSSYKYGSILRRTSGCTASIWSEFAHMMLARLNLRSSCSWSGMKIWNLKLSRNNEASPWKVHSRRSAKHEGPHTFYVAQQKCHLEKVHFHQNNNTERSMIVYLP